MNREEMAARLQAAELRIAELENREDGHALRGGLYGTTAIVTLGFFLMFADDVKLGEGAATMLFLLVVGFALLLAVAAVRDGGPHTLVAASLAACMKVLFAFIWVSEHGTGSTAPGLICAITLWLMTAITSAIHATHLRRRESLTATASSDARAATPMPEPGS